jgi:uncharacterized protein
VTTAGFQERYGPWAVVAGASEGLGAAFARYLARRGMHLLLVARRVAPLDALAAELGTMGVEARALPIDLGLPDVADAVIAACSGLDVGLLVCNAAHSIIGPFLEQPLQGHLTELDVNCRTPLALVHHFGRRMVARGRGGMVLMSSLSAAHGSPLLSHYAATKAWNLVLGEGLWYELRERGVDVIACAAGATDTPAYRATAPVDESVRVTLLPPDAVVEATFRQLGRAPSVIPGMANRFAGFLLHRLLPRRMAVGIMGRTLDRMYSGGPA